MLTTALLTNPVTPAPIVAALADRDEDLTPWQARALAAHPNLPEDHPALTHLAPALTFPDLPAPRATRIAASQTDTWLHSALLEPTTHPAVAAELWSRCGPTGPTGHLEAIAVCPTTPAAIAREALHAVLNREDIGDPLALVWAATLHHVDLRDVPGTATHHDLAALATIATADPDPHQRALEMLIEHATNRRAPWEAVLNLTGDAGVPAAMADGPDAQSAVLEALTVSAPLRVTALTTLAATGSARTMANPRALGVGELADHLTDDDLTVVITSPTTVTVDRWAPLLGGTHLTARALVAAWQAARDHLVALDGTLYADATGLVELATTIAAHPATDPVTARAALTAAREATAGAGWAPVDRRVPGLVAQVTADPAGTPLPDLRDPTPRWQQTVYPSRSTIKNLTRHVSAAVATDLTHLAGASATASAVAALLPDFAGTWRELVATAHTIAA